MSKIIAAFCFLFFMNMPALAASESHALFEELALELAEGLEGVTGSAAIWPFHPDDIPISRFEAARYTRLMENAFVRHKDPSLRLVTRSQLKNVMEVIEQEGTFDGVVNPTVALAESEKLEILIKGDIYPSQGFFKISFQALDIESGDILAATSERRLIQKSENDAFESQALSFSAAIDQAVDYFVGSGMVMEQLDLFGVREARTREVTDFGAYVSEHISTQLANRLARIYPDFNMRIRSGRLVEKARKEGLQQPKTALQQNYHFKMEGHYWNLGDIVDLTIRLSNASKEQVAWKGKILVRSIPHQLLGTSSTSSAIRDFGPIGLELSSNFGENPQVQIGDQLILWVEVKRDAYLNCFYKQGDGKVFKIYPNRFIEGPRSLKQGWINGGDIVEIPGKTAGFKFTVAPPLGREDLHCFATDRDVSSLLPDQIGGRDLEPLDSEYGNALSDIYRRLDNIRLSEATMTITVREDDRGKEEDDDGFYVVQ